MRLGLLAALLASTLPAQWLETVIPLPDSLGGTISPEQIVYNPANHCLYAGGYDGVVHVLTIEPLRRVARIETGRLRVACLACSPASNKVYVAAPALWPFDTVLTVIDGATHTIATRIPVGRQPRVLCYNPAGNKLYCANYGYTGDSTVSVIDCAKDSVLTTIVVGDRPLHLSYCPVGNKVYCACPGGLRAIDAWVDTVATVTAVPGEHLLYNPTYNKLYCAYGEDLHVVDCVGDTELAILQTWRMINYLSYDSISNKLYCGSQERGGTIIVVDGACDSVLTMFETNPDSDGFISDVRCSAGQGRVYCSRTAQPAVEHEVVVIDGSGDSVVNRVQAGERPLGIAVVPEQDRAYCVCADGEDIVAIDAGDTLVAVVPLGSFPFELAFDRRYDKLYIADDDNLGTVIAVDGATLTPGAHVPVGRSSEYITHSEGQGKVYSACTYSDHIAVIDCATDSVIALIPSPRHPTQLIYNDSLDMLYCLNVGSPDNILVACGIGDTVVTTISVYGGANQMLLCAPELNRLYHTELRGAHTKRLYIIDCLSNTVRDSVVLEGEPLALCYNPVRRKLYCAMRVPSSVAVVDAQGDSLLRTVYLTGEPSGEGSLAYNPLTDRVYLAGGSDTGYVTVICGAGDTVIGDVHVGHTPKRPYVDTLSNKVYCQCYDMIAVLDGATDSLVRTFDEVATYWASDEARHRIFMVANISGGVFVFADSSAAVSEPWRPAGRGSRHPATVQRGTDWLSELEDATIWDACGRLVLRTRPSEVGKRHLGPGVYFVLSESAREARRVVVVR